ncbi:unnamed protein product [Blepharisma stoltei]|uniref:Uncharacterized protein n=1 Tax=Blepharisma stoltei TaxID=1481888 RepID=A0AAU9JDB4_9CILI|nr:unnamed protein product [Blepharisma stoltei]
MILHNIQKLLKIPSKKNGKTKKKAKETNKRSKAETICRPQKRNFLIYSLEWWNFRDKWDQYIESIKNDLKLKNEKSVYMKNQRILYKMENEFNSQEIIVKKNRKFKLSKLKLTGVMLKIGI